MNRLIVGLWLIFGVAWAQAPFTIVRPLDGARVRETVQVRFPIRSVPQGGFIGVSIDGKFVEAVAPASLRSDRERGHYIYEWNTKARNVPDGQHTIELTLYSGTEGGNPRVLARSSVRVIVENEIKPPAGGIRLQYRWLPPGKIVRYNMTYTVKESTEIQYSGLTPEENTLYELRFKGDLNVLDWRNNLGLISWIVFPPAVRGAPGQYEVLTGKNFAPVYQEVESTGRVRYQNARIGEQLQQEYDVLYYWVGDLAIIPPKPLKPGDRWTGTIVLGNPLRSGDISEVAEDQVPAAARLERFEWERGYKCAKIVYEFTGNLPGDVDVGGIRLEKAKIKFRRETYFAYDIGQIVRQRTTIEIETTQREQAGASGGFMGGGAPPMGGRGGFAGGDEDEGGMIGGRGARGPRGGGLGLPGGAPGAPGGLGAGGQAPQRTINRLTINEDMVLDKIL
ncbi:hypothetical protein GBSOP10_105937 [Armatimonadetes bacterium GBS]|jgi:hypothetical protein|nr:hypothetical protein HRbin14_02092 [bacterium HR14]GIV13165.1 MAG: hypothetical protein KatS3mg021_1447 [Fimbriimonadales bacterium]CUU09454.1 hypothetical protein GBSOP10_105937 [Armatimonadetes bacterium GBS]